MIKSLVKLALLLAIGIVGYNYFLGTPEEKASSKAIVNEVKELGKSVGNLLKAEKEKFDKGKYDDALTKIGNVYDKLKSKVKDGGEMLDKIKALEGQKEDLEKQMEFTAKGEEGEAKTEEESKLKDALEKLIKKTEELATEVEENAAQ